MTPELSRLLVAVEAALEAHADRLEFGVLLDEAKGNALGEIETAQLARLLADETTASTLRHVQHALRQAREELGG